MRGQHGIEIIAAFKKERPEIKIIAMSGGARPGPGNVLQSARAAGADDILAEPFEMNLLKDICAGCPATHPPVDRWFLIDAWTLELMDDVDAKTPTQLSSYVGARTYTTNECSTDFSEALFDQPQSNEPTARINARRRAP